MKRITILLALSFCISCSAQKTSQKPVYVKVATVTMITGDQALLSTGKTTHYLVPAHQDLEVNKEYVFYLDITDCDKCPTKTAVIVGDPKITTQQAQKDQAAEREKVEEYREVITQ